ncbi:MAG: divalent-cation tolerance protein CutA [Verrucomicrobiales bacterium]|nr:divalent-cation tolerance protein CutA [Verrucomicrobiales bacterium]
MAKDQYILILTTFPDTESARQIGTLLIELQIAACVNILPASQSIYRWQGKIENKTEVPVFIKSTKNNYPNIETRIQEAHPDQVPEIISMPIDQGSPAYLAWISESTFD